MSQTLQTGLTSVTGNVTTNISAGTPTQIQALTATQGANGTATLGTVGAGKTWYIVGYTLGACLGIAGAAQNTTGTLAIAAANIDSVGIGFSGTTPNAITATKAICFPFTVALVAAEGEAVTLVVSGVSNANNIHSATIFFFEV